MDFYYNLIILFGLIISTKSVKGNIQHSTPSYERPRAYQIINPVIYHKNKARGTTQVKDGHLDAITLRFEAFDKPFVADLTKNRVLFADSYIEKSYGVSQDRVEIKRPQTKGTHCFYHGEVRGDRHSMVAVSTCGGISGLITYDKRTYHIEPAPNSGRGAHKLFIDHDDRLSTKHSCGESEDKHSKFYSNAAINYLHTRDVFRRMKRSIHGPYDSNANTRYVEMYLVNDYRTYTNYQGDERKIIRRSQDIVNIVSRLYNPLNIHVALVGVEIWKSRDFFIISDQANATLESFLHYRQNNINPRHPNDNAQLITGMTFNEGVVGKAIKSSICTHQFSAGVAMNIQDRLVQVATTVAHELGHNFGMSHDNYSYCQCPANKCIMAPISGGMSTQTQWSSCSRNALVENFDIGMDYCLRNKPQALEEGPVCGNGFVEEGEQCDCGTRVQKDCKTRCCNASTCKLSPGAKCATGKCCNLDTCMPKSAATLCRGAYEFCDLPEFCDGESEWCPYDVFRQNGLPCFNEQPSYCYNGKCNSHTAQCKLLWGSTGRVSDPICFAHLNINGSVNGNCGYRWTSRTYSRCDKEDVMCGLLHCVHLNEKLMFWRESLAAATPASFLTKGSKQYVCRSAILDVGLNMPDPGQAPDGAKCGQKKICVKQKCESLSKLNIRSCPNCNGHGVCNSIGQCHCNEGFAPPNCNEPGHGGSNHSGPVKIKDSNSIMIGLLVTFAILVISGVLAFVVFYNREYIKKAWRNRSHRDFKYRVPCLGNKPANPPPRNPPAAKSPTKPPSATYKSKNKSVDISNPVLQNSTNKQGNGTAKSLFAKFTGKGATSYAEESDLIPPPKMTLVSKPQPAPPPKPEFKPSPKPATKPLPKLPAKPQNSNTTFVHEPIVKKDSFNKEISKPVLISTTDRRSMAFVKDNSFEVNKNGADSAQVAPPPVPSHAVKSKEKSGVPARPISMPSQPQKLKFSSEEEKKESRKSVVDPKSPPRPPPPNINFTDINLDPPKKSSEPPKRKVFDKAKYKIDTDLKDDILPVAKNRSPASDKKKKVSDSESKALKPLLSTHKTKTSIDKKSVKPVTSVKEKPSSSSSRSIPSKPAVTKQTSNPTPKVGFVPPKPAKPLASQKSDSSSQDSPAVAHIKAMFDSMDIGSKSLAGNNSEKTAVARTNSGGGSDRPRPPPKPGAGSSKVRSVNV